MILHYNSPIPILSYAAHGSFYTIHTIIYLCKVKIVTAHFFTKTHLLKGYFESFHYTDGLIKLLKFIRKSSRLSPKQYSRVFMCLVKHSAPRSHPMYRDYFEWGCCLLFPCLMISSLHFSIVSFLTGIKIH